MLGIGSRIRSIAKRRRASESPNGYGALPPGGGVRREQRLGHPGRFRLGVLVDDALPRLLRALDVAQTEIAEADLQLRVGRLRRPMVEHLLELDQRLAIVALRPVRLTDPVLRVPGERVLG